MRSLNMKYIKFNAFVKIDWEKKKKLKHPEGQLGFYPGYSSMCVIYKSYC